MTDEQSSEEKQQKIQEKDVIICRVIKQEFELVETEQVILTTKQELDKWEEDNETPNYTKLHGVHVSYKKRWNNSENFKERLVRQFDQLPVQNIKANYPWLEVTTPIVGSENRLDVRCSICRSHVKFSDGAVLGKDDEYEQNLAQALNTFCRRHEETYSHTVEVEKRQLLKKTGMNWARANGRTMERVQKLCREYPDEAHHFPVKKVEAKDNCYSSKLVPEWVRIACRATRGDGYLFERAGRIVAPSAKLRKRVEETDNDPEKSVYKLLEQIKDTASGKHMSQDLVQYVEDHLDNDQTLKILEDL